MSEQCGFATNAEHYARIVFDKARVRRIREAAEEILNAAAGKIENVSEFIDHAKTRFLSATQGIKGSDLRRNAGAILELSEFLKKDPPKRQVYLEPWLKEASINMIVGWRGVGKTGFAMGLTSAITNGESFGPWQMATPAPCLYFDAEMTQQDTAERFTSLYQEGTQEPLFILSDHYCNLLGLPGADLCDENWRAWLKDELIKRSIKLWVLDNIGAVTAGIDENSREQWSPINRWLLDLRFAGISTILLHHEGKAGAQRGTSAREDNLDISISLKRPQDYRPEDGARFICHFEKARIRQAELHLVADTEFQMQTDPEGKTVWTFANVKQENKFRVLQMLDEGISRKEIAQILGITGPRVSQIKAEAGKDGLITAAGKLTQTGFEYLLKGAN
ncbi:MAG: AAA family ATPase [Deltaproteobacteria bacterium]|nr:AAA family ATPase [Deltaproteobacteria bacterium]